MRLYRVLVTGGRDYQNEFSMFLALDCLVLIYGPLCVIQGGARGADRLARKWVSCRQGNQLITENADWDELGKAAGLIRNSTMLRDHKPDMILAAPGGRGTADMKKKARLAGFYVQEIK